MRIRGLTILFLIFSVHCIGAVKDSAYWNRYYDALILKMDSIRSSADHDRLAEELLNAGKEMLYSDCYSTAEELISEASQLFLQKNDSVNHAWCLYYLAVSDHLAGAYEVSLERCLRSTEIAVTHREQLLLGHDLDLHGRLYYLLGDEDTAVSYYTQALEIAQRINSPSLKAEASTLTSIVWRNKRDLKAAMKLQEEALALRKTANDERGCGVNYFNIAIIHSYLRNDTAALRYFSMAENIFIAQNDLFSLTECYNAMGKSFLQLNNEAKAEELFGKSLRIALRLRAKKLIRYNYYDLALLNYQHGKNKEAFEQMYRYNLYKDSVLHDQGLLESAQIESRMRDQKKQQEITNLNTSNALKEAELKNNRIVIWAIAGCLSLAVVMAIVIFYNLVQKRKINLLLEEKNAEITEKNQNITDSIRYASGIQESILPTSEILKASLGSHFIIYLPKDIVSGDFYWINRIEERIFFAAADCTGHGVPGAFMSLLGVQTLNQAIIENHIESPARILDFANAKTKELLAHRGLYNTTRDGMDIALCSLDRKKMLLDYAGANNPLWVVRKGELIEMKANKQSIGAAGKPYTDHSVQLQKDDLIYIFTDGFQDQFGGDEHRKIKSKGFRDLLISLVDKPFEKHEEIIRDHFMTWKGEEEQTDDVLVMCVRI